MAKKYKVTKVAYDTGSDVDELLFVLKDAKEVLLQLDHRHDGECYNRKMNEDCQCTLCKINRALTKFDKK